MSQIEVEEVVIEVDVNDSETTVVEVPSDTVLEVEVADRGVRGPSNYEIAVANGFVGTEEQWLESIRGDDGLSAYEVAVAEGFVGDEVAWLASLEGSQGDPGLQGDPGPSAVSADAGNTAVLGDDDLLFVPMPDAADVPFTPSAPLDWTTAPDRVRLGLDELAARKGGLAGYQTVEVITGVADVRSAVEAGFATLIVVFSNTDPVIIELPDPATSSPFTLVTYYPAEPSEVSYRLDGNPATPVTVGSIDVGPSAGAPFPVFINQFIPASDWRMFPLGIPSPGDIGEFGVLGLDEDGEIPTSYFPASLYNVISAANYAAFPEYGLYDTIYIALDTLKLYYFTGTGFTYDEISPGASAAADISVDASGFANNLTPDDDTVQKVADKVDTLSAGGYSSAFLLGGM